MNKSFSFFCLILVAISVMNSSAISLDSGENKRNNQEAFELLMKLSPNELYGNAPTFRTEAMNKLIERRVTELKHDNIYEERELCLFATSENSRSRKYITELLKVLGQSCTFDKEKIEINDLKKIKDFIIEQSFIQEEVVNKIFRDRLLDREKFTNKKARSLKAFFLFIDDLLRCTKLSKCIERSFQSIKQDENDLKLWLINTRSIENYFIVHYFDEIKEKCKSLIEAKKKIYNLVDRAQSDK